MKHKILLYTVALLSIHSYAQVGVNTTLPLQPLHVDPLKNTISPNPTAQQTADDFVVTDQGNVGIGSINPSAKLEVNGTFKLVDGTQAANRVLMGNANGVAHWETLPSVTPTLLGLFDKNAINATNPTTAGNVTGLKETYTNVSITLPKGKWIVNLGLTIDNKDTKTIWLHAFLSTSKTEKKQEGFKLIGPAGNSSAFATPIPGTDSFKSNTAAFGLLAGSMLLEVTDTNPITIYVILEKAGTWSFSTGSWENYLYAIPII